MIFAMEPPNPTIFRILHFKNLILVKNYSLKADIRNTYIHNYYIPAETLFQGSSMQVDLVLNFMQLISTLAIHRLVPFQIFKIMKN